MRTKYTKLNDRFSIGADQFNFILRDEDRGHRCKDSFYSSAEKMLKEICIRYKQDCLLRGELRGNNYLFTNDKLRRSMKELLEDITMSLKHKLEQLKKDVE
jgi:hypothetical protein